MSKCNVGYTCSFTSISFLTNEINTEINHINVYLLHVQCKSEYEKLEGNELW